MTSSGNSRYSGMREIYFASSKPPLIPPKEQTNEHSASTKSSSPSSTPQRTRRASPAHILPGHTHYTQYSHSVPRSHSNKQSRGQGGVVGTNALGQSVARSSSFNHSHEAPPTPPETPPTLPPRPVAPPVKTFKRAQPKFLTDDLTFAELISHFQKSFPLRVYITNGYLGATSRLTISTGDMYNIHFLKRARVMIFRDHHDIPYSIPLNSAIEFGLLYQPKEGRKATEIETGVVFSSTSDLLSQQEMPKVVCVMKSWQSSDAKTSLVTNEVLIIKSAQRSLFAKKGLKVFSLTTKSDKFLSEECSANFTTQPSLCRLHITDIVEYIKQPRGDKCVLFLNSQVLLNRELTSSPGLQSLPDELFDKVLSIVDQVTETSLVASSVLHRRAEVTAEEFDPDKDVLFDVPVDENTSEMTCVVVEMPHTTDTDRLYDDTKTLYEKFDPTKVTSIKDTGGPENAQKILYTTVRHGCEGLGVEIDRPETLYDSIPSQRRLHHQLPTPPPPPPPPPVTPSPEAPAPPPLPLPPTPSPLTTTTHSSSPSLPHRSRDHADRAGSEEYDEISLEALQAMHHGNHPTTSSTNEGRRLVLKVEEMEKQLQQSQSQVASLHSRLEQNMGRVSKLEGEVGRMKTAVDRLLPQVYAIQSRLTHISSSPQTTGPDEIKGSEVKEEGGVGKENRKYLESLNSQQVCNLLGAMELGQYKETFSKENVSGEILMECDDEILRSDLGMVSRLHRLRIMKVIEGRHSAAALIEGVNPYVTMGTK